MTRDALWAAADAVAAAAALVAAAIVRNVWLWLIGWAWVALGYRQLRLAIRTRPGRSPSRHWTERD